MKYRYRPSGVCASMIEFDINDDIITNVKFTGGCNGNSKGISKLVDGMRVDEITKKCEGITCGNKKTSCPSELVKGIKEAQEVCRR